MKKEMIRGDDLVYRLQRVSSSLEDSKLITHCETLARKGQRVRFSKDFWEESYHFDREGIDIRYCDGQPDKNRRKLVVKYDGKIVLDAEIPQCADELDVPVASGGRVYSLVSYNSGVWEEKIIRMASRKYAGNSEPVLFDEMRKLRKRFPGLL